MINGLRRSRIDWSPTEIEASKVGKTRKTPGFPGHRLATLRGDLDDLDREIRAALRALDADLDSP